MQPSPLNTSLITSNLPLGQEMTTVAQKFEACKSAINFLSLIADFKTNHKLLNISQILRHSESNVEAEMNR